MDVKNINLWTFYKTIKLNVMIYTIDFCLPKKAINMPKLRFLALFFHRDIT